MIHPPPASFVLASVTRRALPDEGPGGGTLIWLLAALIVAGLHAGIYLVVTGGAAAPPPPPVIPAAVMVSLAPIPVTARSEVENQADGPPSTASEEAIAPEPPPIVTTIPVPPPPPDVTTQAMLDAPPPKPEAETPKRPPEKLIKKPELAKKPQPAKRPKTSRNEHKVAARNGGGPRSDRQTADLTAASSAGDAGSATSRVEWQSEVRSRIVRAKHFPSEAHGAIGVATVSVTFTTSGRANNIRLVASSGNAALDTEAVAVMARAAPYPPPPSGRPTPLTIPLNFRR